MGLKKINDRFGHKAGDELLIKCADCLKSVFGEYGTFRTGGDEFIALCEGISDTELYSRVEKLDALAEVWVCRMAIGCTWNKDGNENIHKLFAEADERMYEDKRQRYKTGLYNSLMYSG
jgi:diguanylate cyclase (GGDEF)-like protein